MDHSDSSTAAHPPLSAEEVKEALASIAAREPDYSGHYTESYIVTLPNGRYLLRRKRSGFDGYDPRQLSEAVALRMANEQGIRSPRLAYEGDKFLIETYIQGTPASEAGHHSDWYHLLLKEVELLRSHPVRTDMYRDVIGWQNWLMNFLKTLQLALSKPYADRFEAIRLPRIQDVWGPAQIVPQCGLVLTHSDLHPANILISSSGLWILDWELALVADPFWESAAALNRTAWSSLGERAEARAVWLASFAKNWPEREVSTQMQIYENVELWKSLVVDSVRYPEAIAESHLDGTTLRDRASNYSGKLIRAAAAFGSRAMNVDETAALLKAWSVR